MKQHPSYLEDSFRLLLAHYKITGWQAEFRFCPNRRWRFDFAWPTPKVAVEIEGGVWMTGRHQRARGYLNDCEKYETALMLGWTVYRVPGPWVATPKRHIWRAEMVTNLRRMLDREI